MDPRMPYRKQDPEKLAKIFKAGWREHPYLTPQRFPAHWAQSAMLRQYLSNLRKYLKCHGRLGNPDDSPSSSGRFPDGRGPPPAGAAGCCAH
ncbi:hypothetical protein GGG16DRAFT_117523 [Schizophyllum commune]